MSSQFDSVEEIVLSFMFVFSCVFVDLGIIKTSRFIECQIVKSLREHDGGRSSNDIFRELGISSATFYGSGLFSGE